MPRYTRPDLAAIDPAEVSDFLLERGISVQTRLSPAGLVIDADVNATAALAAFVPTSTMDRTVFPFRSNYLPPIPAGAAVAQHLAHLRDFRNAVRAGTDGAITLPQLRHVVADAIDALRLLDSRLDRDA